MISDELQKFIEENRKGFSEIRESQRKTEELIKQNAERQKQTDEQLKQTDEQQKKTDEQQKKTDEQQKKTGELIRQIAERQNQTDEQMKKTDERIDRLGKRFGDFGNNRGEEVEEFFYRYFEKNPRLQGTTFDEVERNIITSDGDEHDIVLVNGEVTALISVKYKLHKKDVDKLVSTELKRIQHFFGKLGSRHRLYGGVASYIVKEDVQKYAESKGLYVISRSGDNTVVLNKDNFQAKVF